MFLHPTQKRLIDEIKSLKARKKAVILVHNYQKPEIYEIADYIGDSLGLSEAAARTNAKIILFCGVYFMAETAKILNPGKKVIVPFKDAGCAMADMICAEDLKKMKKRYPDAACIAYINSTAEVKALADVCCTSSNAVEIVRSLKEKKIIFVPDKNLALYVASKVPEKEIIPWEGYCPAHNYITKEYLEDVKKSHPDAKIIAHPESKPEVLEIADYVSSTSGMINCAKKDSAKEFFILTECGMIERLKKELSNKKFYGVCNICFDMKKTTLESVLRSLQTGKFVVEVDKTIAFRAKISLDKMLKVKNDG